MSMWRKVALITGGAQGLGRGFAETLLKDGANVCVADVKVQTGETTVSDFQKQYGSQRAMFVKCDVTKEQDIKATFDAIKKKFGRIDMVVNNAGIADEESWDKMVDINVKGIILGTMYGIEAMRKDKGGNGGIIVNIASAAGLAPVYPMPVYAATKHGVVGYTRSWAQNPQTQSMGITFTCLCPTFTDTPILKLEEQDVGFQQMVDMIGVMQVSDVVHAFELLTKMPDNNGVVMRVTKKKGPQVIDWNRKSRM